MTDQRQPHLIASRFVPAQPKTLLSLAVASAIGMGIGLEARAADTLDEILVEDIAPAAMTEFKTTGDSVADGPSSDAGEALRNIPGVSAVRMGGHGVDPVIRGQSATRLNILLDGAYIHGGCPNRMDPPTSYAPIETFDEVTVIKGNHSVAYGAGGSGGTVLLSRNTRPLDEGEFMRGKAAVGYRGNSDIKDGFADLTVGNQTTYLRGIVTAKDGSNYEDGNGNEVRSAFEEHAVSLLFGVLPEADSKLEFGFDMSRADDVLFAGAGMDSPQADDDTVRLRYAKKGQLGVFENVKAELYVSDVSHVMDNYTLRNQTGAFKRAPSTSNTSGGRLTGDIVTADGDTWSLGVDIQNNHRDADRFNDTVGRKEAILWPGAAIEQSGVFAELTMPMDQDSLNFGLRYDRITAEATRADEAPAIGTFQSPNQLYTLYYGNTASKQTENNIGGFARYEHAFEDLPGSGYLSFSRSVRTADATERYLGSGAPGAMANMRWSGNPDLDPEQHHQLETGAELLIGEVQVSGSVYYDKVNDYILRDRAHGQSGILLNDNATIYRNVDARLYGTEIGAEMDIDNHWTLGGNLAYTHATNTTDSRAIAQTPPLEASISLDYHSGGLSLGGTLRGVSKQTRVDDDVNTGSGLDVGQTGGFAVLNLRGGMKLDQGFKVSFGVDNVFDRAYAEHLNKSSAFDATQVQVNEPGRSLWVNLGVTF